MIHLGLDVSKDTIAVAILRPEELDADAEKFVNDEASIRRLVDRFDDPRRLRACFEAGPTGFELHRLLESLRVCTDVIAPSLIPRRPGDRVKTDKRDCRRLARLHRAGELTAVRVPTRAEEGVRDLCRARHVAVTERRRARQRLSAFLLRHNEAWREHSWTFRHQDWIAGRHFADPATQAALIFYRAAVDAQDTIVGEISSELADWFDTEPFALPVHRLAAYRGIDHLGALSIVSEVCDFRRFAHAGAFMSFCGLVPQGYSSGQSSWRGHLTLAGNVHVRTQLVESAWAYSHAPRLGVEIARRQDGLPQETIQRAWRAQLRLCGRFRRLSTRKDSRNLVIAAIARELAGFVYAELTA